MALLFTSQIIFGQDRTKYSELISEAYHLYQQKNYLQSGQKYSEAFMALGNKGVVNDRYNAACAWALAGKPDSAFVQLFKIAEKGNYTNLPHITSDPDLKSLYADDRWTRVLDIIKANKEKAEANLDKELVAILDTVYQDDQKYRLQIEGVEAEYGADSKEVDELWRIIKEKDSINLFKVTKILDERGWLGPDIVGSQGSSTLFLVIQHSDHQTQVKYLPMMREAVKTGKASASSLALLEDRVALRNGEMQIYGSQIARDTETGEYYVLPLIDPDNVNIRRAEVGLGPIEEYIAIWGLKWDAEEYKKRLPEYEKKQKK